MSKGYTFTHHPDCLLIEFQVGTPQVLCALQDDCTLRQYKGIIKIKAPNKVIAFTAGIVMRGWPATAIAVFDETRNRYVVGVTCTTSISLGEELE